MRENRTYDQVLGDDARGDGDPKLTLLGRQVTPNVHILVKRFPLLDRVFANSEASIDGHFWTSAAKVSDYVNKAWFQNYAGRGRPYDFGVYEVTWPATSGPNVRRSAGLNLSQPDRVPQRTLDRILWKSVRGEGPEPPPPGPNADPGG